MYYTINIIMMQAVGSVLPDVLLDASDRDTQGEDWITYTLVNQGALPLGAHLFSPSNVTSLVYVADVITIDTPGVTDVTYQMLIHVTDSFGLTTAPVTLDVTVYDVNDHVPVFNPTSYTGTVSGMSVYRPTSHYILLGPKHLM